MITRVQGPQFLKGETEHYEALSLFLVKYSVLNLFLVLACMQFPILDHYILFRF